MKARPRWYFDEARVAGLDFTDAEVARDYDRHMRKLERDPAGECEAILAKLRLGADDRIVDLGCGTGIFALEAACRCGHVYAVDVAPAMLAVAAEKADAQGLRNVSFHRGGFLTYVHDEAPVDAVVSQRALHHLPDFWKLVGLRNVAEMLADEGKLYLSDFVYAFDPARYREFFEALLATMDAEDARKTELHIREEYSTLDWVMEGLLRQAGFRILAVAIHRGYVAEYVCRKSESAAASRG